MSHIWKVYKPIKVWKCQGTWKALTEVRNCEYKDLFIINEFLAIISFSTYSFLKLIKFMPSTLSINFFKYKQKSLKLKKYK